MKVQYNRRKTVIGKSVFSLEMAKIGCLNIPFYTTVILNVKVTIAVTLKVMYGSYFGLF